jgi:hypothetical protein
MCVLKASGTEFDPDAFLDPSQLVPCKVFRRGEPRLPKSQPHGPIHETSGINIYVSDSSWSDLPAQVADAERFLTENREQIIRLAQAPGVTEIVLDFPIELRIDGENIVAQFDRFPTSLVRLVGALGIALELSIYSCSEDEEHAV